jgi:uncharacterized Tic20 family protein
MSHLLRRTKRRYRDFRPSPEVPRLYFHISISIISGLMITTAISIITQPQTILQNISHLHRFIGTCFALFFSVLAIVLAFRNGSADRPINELKRAGLLSNIIQRYYLSVFVTGVLYLVLTGIAVFNFHMVDVFVTIPIESKIEFNLANMLVLLVIIFSLIFTIIRLASCFYIFYRLETNLR